MMGLSLSDQGSAPLVFQLKKQSRHALTVHLDFFSEIQGITRFYLSLTLLVSEVVADHHDATSATNNFALIANLLHAWLDLHELPSFMHYIKIIYCNKFYL